MLEVEAQRCGRRRTRPGSGRIRGRSPPIRGTATGPDRDERWAVARCPCSAPRLHRADRVEALSVWVGAVFRVSRRISAGWLLWICALDNAPERVGRHVQAQYSPLKCVDLPCRGRRPTSLTGGRPHERGCQWDVLSASSPNSASARRANRWAPRSTDSACACSATARKVAADSPRACSTRARSRSSRLSA